MSSQPEPDNSVIAHNEVEQLREAREIIRHEAQALSDLSRRLDRSFCAAVDLLRQCTGAVVVTGMGKAGIVAQKIAATLSSTGTRAFFLHPAEAVHGDLGCVRRDDVVLALSNSGETDEICRLLPILRQIGVPLVAITSKDTSRLGTEADVTVALGHVREAGRYGLAPTASTTAMLALGDALALVVSQMKGFTRQQFAVFHPAGSLGQKLKSVRDMMRKDADLRIAAEQATVREVFVQIRKPGRRTGAVMLVNEQGCLSGLFTDSDLVRLLEGRRENQFDRPIREVMIHRPLTIEPEAPLADAIHMLSTRRISELPVVDPEGRPIGLVDITDVIALMPEDRVEQ